MKPLNQKGISIIEVLIATGIMAIVMAGFSSMLLNQNKETKSVSEVLAGLDLQKNLIIVLAEGSVCNHILNNPAQLTFNSSALPQTIIPTLPIYASMVSGTPGVVVAQIGQQASVYSTTMIIKSIRLNIISGSGTTYTGNWVIDFDETKSVRPHKPIAIGAVLNVDNTVPAATKITGCMGKSGPGPVNSLAKWTAAGLGGSGVYEDNLGNVGIGTNTPTAALDVVGAGKVSGVLSSGKVQVVDVVVANTACVSNGLVARDAVGVLLSCQSGLWKNATGGSGTGFFSNGYGAYRINPQPFGTCLNINTNTGGCSCPAGSTAQSIGQIECGSGCGILAGSIISATYVCN